MKTAILHALILSLSLWMCSCSKRVNPSGDIEHKKVDNISGLTGVSISSGFIVEISKDSVESIDLYADDNILPYVQISDKNHILKADIDHKKCRITGSSPSLKLIIKTKNDLNSFSATSGSVIATKSTMNSKETSIYLSSGATFWSDGSAQIITENLNIEASNGSTVQCKGNSNKTSIQLYSGSVLSGLHLITGAASMNLTGGSEASITVNGNLSVNATEGSTVYYAGNPIITSQILLGGSILSKFN